MGAIRPSLFFFFFFGEGRALVEFEVEEHGEGGQSSGFDEHVEGDGGERRAVRLLLLSPLLLQPLLLLGLLSLLLVLICLSQLMFAGCEGAEGTKAATPSSAAKAFVLAFKRAVFELCPFGQ